MEVNRINPKVGIPNREKEQVVWVPLNLKEVIDWINKKPYDEYLKSELVKSASKYPGNALRDFVNQLPKHVARINKKRKEDNGE